LRIGFITFSNKLINDELCRCLEEKTAGAVRGNVSNCSHLSQSLLLAAYQSDGYDKDKEKKYNLLEYRYNKVKDILQEKYSHSEYFDIVPYNSGYFMCLKLKGIDPEEVRQVLLKDYDTGIMAIGDLIRVAYSSLASDLIELLFENIEKACEDVKNIMIKL
jgi:aspartate/methionine/tyrosine aminotransferase